MKILDLFEYASDAEAQTAYPPLYTADLVPQMTSNTTPEGVASASSAYDAAKAAWHAFDNTVAGDNRWNSAAIVEQWLQYKFTSSKIIERYTLQLNELSPAGPMPKDWTFQGSNDGVNFTILDTRTNETGWVANEKRTYDFNNTTAYLYYRINITAVNVSGNWPIVPEMEMMASVLKPYSEPTIKTQGSYSLKGFALITDSLNQQLLRTIASPIDLSGLSRINFYIRSSRTGSNIKIGIRDSGGTWTEITPNIVSANTWQEILWDISGVSNANKDAIDRIAITIVNAAADNTFYIDNMYAEKGGLFTFHG